MDEHCTVAGGELFKDFHCLLNQVAGKSDKFYVIQIVTDSKGGCYIFTRWGRNGTVGQMNLEGPIDQSKAETMFKKKFNEKTKNSWDDRMNFSPKKGKYTLVAQKDQGTSSMDVQQTSSKNLEAEVPDLPNTHVSGITLPADVLYKILSHLHAKDALRCMQVCKIWKAMLSEKYFWKMLINKHFDLSLQSDVRGEGPFGQWADPDEWFPYYDNQDDVYVMRPFPSMWKCGVIHPFGLDPLAGDVRSLQGFCRSLEILTHMRNMARKFGICSGNECSASEGGDDICAVLFPWEKAKLPRGTDILKEYFHVHPEIYEAYYSVKPSDEIRNEKLMFHLPEREDDEDDYSERLDHDIEEEPCLNRIFGFGSFDGTTVKEVTEFYSWLQKIMVPTNTIYAGSDKLNPVLVFFITKLAPGWAGGALTAVIYT